MKQHRAHGRTCASTAFGRARIDTTHALEPKNLEMHLVRVELRGVCIATLLGLWTFAEVFKERSCRFSRAECLRLER